MLNKNGLMSGTDVCATGFIDSNLYLRKQDGNTGSYTQYLIGSEAGATTIYGDVSANFVAPTTGNYILEATLVCDTLTDFSGVSVIGTSLKDITTGIDNEYGAAIAGASLVKPPAIAPPGANPNTYSFGLSSTHTLIGGRTYSAVLVCRNSGGLVPPATFEIGLVLSISSL